MNRWTVSILLFHFTLVHVPGTRHGPDGLSRRPQQPADEDGEPAEDPEFDDWVDQVYGFMHLLNPLKPKVPCPGACPTYISNTVADKPLLTYDLFPQSDRSRRANDHLRRVRTWFEMLWFNLVRVEIRELRPEVVAESDEVLVHYRSRTNV